MASKNTPEKDVQEGANRETDQRADDAARDGHRDPVMEDALENTETRDKDREKLQADAQREGVTNDKRGDDGLTTVDREQKFGVIPEMSGPGGLPGTENRV